MILAAFASRAHFSSSLFWNSPSSAGAIGDRYNVNLPVLNPAGSIALAILGRNSLLDLVDRLIVIDSGRIVADGPKDRVVAALRSGQIEKAE